MFSIDLELQWVRAKADDVPGNSTNRKARQKVQKDLGLAVEMVENIMSSNILRMRDVNTFGSC